jgi:tol-pal system protein YbgF
LKVEIQDLQEKNRKLTSAIKAKDTTDLVNDIMEIRKDMTEMTGKLEEDDHLIDKNKKDIDFLKEYFSSSIDGFKTRISSLEDRLSIKSEGDTPPVSTPGEEPLNPAEIVTTPPGAEPVPVAATGNAEAMYNDANAAYQRPDIPVAIQKFQQFVKKYPKHTLADKAQFYLGECFYDTRKFDDAILAYQELRENYPKSAFVKNAILKQGFSFLEMGAKDEAKAFFQELSATYPKSKEADIARKKLKAIK